MHELPLGGAKGSLLNRLGRLGQYLRSKTFLRALVVMIGTMFCLAIFILTVTPKRYNLYVGMVPNQTIAANKDVIDEATTLKNREAAADTITPTYHYQLGVSERVMSKLEAVYAQMVAVRQYAKSLPDYSGNRSYTQEEFAAARDLISLVNFQDFQLATLMNATDTQFDEMYAALSPAIRNTMQGNVTQSQESIAITGIMQIVGFKTNISLLQNVVLPVLQAIIEPNMVVDTEATDQARAAAWEAVEPVVIKQGQNIVVHGEGRIRENQIAILNSLGLLNDNSVDYAMYIGSFLMVSAILALMSVLIKFFCARVFLDIKRLLIIYLAAIFVLAMGWLAKSVQLIYLAPLVLPYMLLTVTVGILPGMIVGVSTTLIASIMLTNTGNADADLLNLLTMALFSGSMSALLLHRKYQRSYILLAGVLISVSSFLVILAIGLMTSMSLTNTLNKALWSLGGGAVNTLLCLALQPAIETLFNLPTPMRLLDLTNPNHPLMRRLLLEAPGTYHHSIIIANLAEASAEAIGANPLLARAGAYFHDIGKLKRPLYFKENQIGAANMHDTTDPQISAAIIISHVREGISLAKQNHLPYEIQQIIAEHHGNSVVAFFYHKAVNEANGHHLDDSEFRYDGVPPQTAEGTLVMLCDTIEAAIRTLSKPTKEEILEFIEDLIKNKIDSGLLANAPLTLKDLSIVRDTCAAMIHGVFHERIEYPPIPSKLQPAERLLAHLQHFRNPIKPTNEPEKSPESAPPLPRALPSNAFKKPTQINKAAETGNAENADTKPPAIKSDAKT